jgi:hypothetical protein
MKTVVKFRIPWKLRILCALLILIATTANADNKVLGEVGFEGATNLEQDSGVWVDGQYLGYLKELKGSKKVLLLPGGETDRSRGAGERSSVSNAIRHRRDKTLG